MQLWEDVPAKVEKYVLQTDEATLTQACKTCKAVAEAMGPAPVQADATNDAFAAVGRRADRAASRPLPIQVVPLTHVNSSGADAKNVTEQNAA